MAIKIFNVKFWCHNKFFELLVYNEIEKITTNHVIGARTVAKYVAEWRRLNATAKVLEQCDHDFVVA